MSENIDRRIEAIVDRLDGELVREDGSPADHDHIADVVHTAAEPLADAPIQDYVPLLVENEARDVLHDEGLHRELPPDAGGPVHSRDTPPTDAVPIARP